MIKANDEDETVVFHLAFPVHDMDAARNFYVEKLFCRLGRISKTSMILNFHGTQLVAQLVGELPSRPKGIYPRHFGLVFSKRSEWVNFLEHCRALHLSFYREAAIRHQGEITEHDTFFLIDPSHNLLEFKYYKNSNAVFEAGESGQVGD